MRDLIQVVARNPFVREMRRIGWLLRASINSPTLRTYSGVVIRQCHFEDYVTLYDNVHIHSSSVGALTYIQSDSIVLNTKVGRFSSIAHDVSCGLGLHPSSGVVSNHPSFYSIRRQAQITFADKDYFQEFMESRIGNDVLIGTGAVIKDGVTVGDGAIIGAGAVVTKDVSPYSIVGGVPAKLIRYRFTEDQISALLRIRWWEKDLNWIRANWQYFLEVDTFLQKFKT